MSGQAGWTIKGSHHSISIGSGLSVDVAIPPGDDGSAVGEHFDRESTPYRLWLERAQPALDALFQQLLAEGLPLVPLDGSHEQVDGAILEDVAGRGDGRDRDAHFRKHHRGGTLLVHVAGGQRLPDFQSLNLHLAVSTRVRRSQLEAIADRVAAVLLANRQEPLPPVEPPPAPTPPPSDTPVGAFGWLRRMGVHEAYHLHPTNRLVHWLCIPLQLLMFVKLLSLAAIGPIDLAQLAIAAVAVVYLIADLVAGALMALLLVGLWALARQLSTGVVWLDGVLAAVLFAATFLFQTRVGHGVFERGVDDTALNLAELKRTGNPIPILLVFYYHLVELLFAAGYRPSLRAAMEHHRHAALAALPDDPRP